MRNRNLGFRRKWHKLQCPQWVLSLAYGACFWAVMATAYFVWSN